MKRLLAVALCVAALVVLALPAYSAQFIQYKQLGPISFCTGCAAVTGETDSTFKYGNLAMATDTSGIYAWPSDIAWGAVSDSLPIIVRVTRPTAGAATDSFWVNLQTAYGGGTGTGKGLGTIPAAFVSAGWDNANLAQIGANMGGAAFFVPTRASTNTLSSVNKYTVPAYSWGSTVFRVLCKSYIAGTGATQFQVFVNYPTIVKW